MRLDVQQKLKRNKSVDAYAELCTLCQTYVQDSPGQGCYWTCSRIYHIDCITCPRCNGPPRVVYGEEGRPIVECLRCEPGSIMEFVSRRFGSDFQILHSTSQLLAHLLWVAWFGLANVLMPNIAYGKWPSFESLSRVIWLIVYSSAFSITKSIIGRYAPTRRMGRECKEQEHTSLKTESNPVSSQCCY